ncbi:MAG TPA: helix-turn-helix transcriptional regulator [Rhodocyclaceae bacterium]|nr:helix-turn-helix transcriptional regulator [Rhodocyclaceae bacterium]
MNVNLPQEFSARLREERKRLGMSQTTFAKAVGIHLNSQSRYEKGERAPDTAYLGAIAKLGVDMSFLLTGDRGNDSQLEIESARAKSHALVHVLSQIQGFLGFWPAPMSYEFEKAMQDVYEAHQKQWEDPMALDRADVKLLNMLQRSPSTLPTVQELAEILWGLELVEKKLGVKLAPSVRANSFHKACQETKLSGRALRREEIERIVRTEACLIASSNGDDYS